MGWWHLWLSAKILPLLRLSVNFIQLRLTIIFHFSLSMLRCVSPFLAWSDFHTRSRFARSTIPEEKWGTTRSLPYFLINNNRNVYISRTVNEKTS